MNCIFWIDCAKWFKLLIYYIYWNSIIQLINKTTFVLSLALSLSSIPFYGFDYLVTGPLGFVSQDVVFKNTIFDQTRIKDFPGIGLLSSAESSYKYVDIDAPSLPKGRDRVILPDSNSVVWARFYEIGTNRPMFSGRDSIKKYAVSEIEQERRIGYGWYGTWPLELLEKDYPSWVKKIANK